MKKITWLICLSAVFAVLSGACVSTSDEPAIALVTDPPAAEPTPQPLPEMPASVSGPGTVSLLPERQTVGAGDAFTVELFLDSGDQKLAAYGIDLAFNDAIISVDTGVGDNGVTEGEDGFVAAVNANDRGILLLSGFDINGKGPGKSMHLVTTHWQALTSGATKIIAQIRNLTNETYLNIGTPQSNPCLVIVQ